MNHISVCRASSSLRPACFVRWRELDLMHLDATSACACAGYLRGLLCSTGRAKCLPRQTQPQLQRVMASSAYPSIDSPLTSTALCPRTWAVHRLSLESS
jgi:hypothetical protein